MRYGNIRNASDKVFSEKRKFIPYPALEDAKSSDVVHNLVHTVFSSVGSQFQQAQLSAWRTANTLRPVSSESFNS